LRIIRWYAERVRFNAAGNEITLWLRGAEPHNPKSNYA
jgi:hypothetical protein